MAPPASSGGRCRCCPCDRWRAVLPAPGPGAGEQSQAEDFVQQAPPLPSLELTAANEDPDLQLCNTTWARTVASTAVASSWIFAGLLVIGLAVGRERPETVIALRLAGFMFIFYVPISGIAIPNLRMHIFSGLQPRFAFATLFRPWRLKRAAREQGHDTWCQVRAFCAPLVYHAGWLGVYALLTCVPIGGQHQFFGYVVIYGAGHVLCIFWAVVFVDRLAPPALHLDYAVKSGAATGAVMNGFFILTSGFALLQRNVGSWLGWFAGLVVLIYEGVGVLLVGRICATEILRPEVREATAGTRQGLQISAVVSLLQGLAEGARMTLLVADVSEGNQEKAWVYMLLGSALINIPSRLGWQAWLVRWGTGGRLCANNFYWLLQDVRYTMGYPCFACLAPIAAVRWLLGHSLLPGGRAELAWALLCALAAEVFEDLAVGCGSRCGLQAPPAKPARLGPLDLEDAGGWSSVVSGGGAGGCPSEQPGAGADGRSAQQTCGGTGNCSGEKCGDDGAAAAEAEQAWQLPGAVGDAEESAQAESAAGALGPPLTWGASSSASREAALVLEKKRFLHGEMHFGQLPLWCHFSVVMMVQFHVVLFLVVFANGFEYVLGFCDEPGYKGVARGLVWWPLISADNPCG